jgi:L-iditol 2-dehydrogenase
MTRVAELAGLREFRLRDGATPPPAPGEVQVKVKHVGICGSDIHYFAEGGVGPARCVYPMVLGHEPAGEIIAAGDGVSGWSAGDPVVMEPALYCYHCEFCMSGRHNVCSNMRFMSTPVEPGFFRDVVNLPARNVLAPPAGVSLAEATLFEPLAVVAHSMTFAQPKLGESALVIGAGPIGLLTIALLRLAGVGRIWCTDPVAHRRQMARSTGADAVFDSGETEIAAVVASETSRRGVDIAIDCATQGDTINQCLRAARNAGRVVITGIPSTMSYDIDIHALRVKELYFYTVRRSNHTEDLALRLLREHPKTLGGIVTHRRPADEINATFRMVEQYESGVGKAVIDF